MKAKLTYLNGILTFIAVALTVLILQNAQLIPKAYAGTKGDVTDVNIVQVDGWSTFGKVPVEVKNEVKVKN